MKFMRIALSLSLAMIASQHLWAEETRQIQGRQYVRDGGKWHQVDSEGQTFEVNPRVLTVKFKQGVGEDGRRAVHSSIGTSEIRLARTGFVDVEIPAGEDVFDVIDAYLGSGKIEIAEPNTFGTYLAVANDSLYGLQWHLPKIKAEAAWDVTTGDPAVIVAVLDSGTEFAHEDLGPGTDGYQNVWLNSGEDAWSSPDNPATGNGVDDDLNGFVDDWKGYDFSNDNNDSSGSFFHGTAVAGGVSAKTHNSQGVAGVAGGWTGPGVRIMIAGVGDSGPDTSAIDDAILYAGDMGAHVVQLSLSVGQTSAIEAALQMAWDVDGMIIICSSGNGGGSSVAYPASNPNVMAVGSTSQADTRSGFSQHGPDLEISAPGETYWTLDLNDTYDSTGGTSFSSPTVSGVVGLMLSVAPTLTNARIRQILKDTADKVGGYNYDWDPTMPGHSFELGYGRVDAEEAVNVAALSGEDIFEDGFESGDTGAWDD